MRTTIRHVRARHGYSRLLQPPSSDTLHSILCGDVRPHLLAFEGLFVGGTDPWKKATVASWVKLAHENNLLCHLGRAGTYNKVKLAKAAGVDSIDSSLPLMSQQFFAEFLAALRDEPKHKTNQLNLW